MSRAVESRGRRVIGAAAALASVLALMPAAARAQGSSVDIAPVDVTAKKQKPAVKRPAKPVAAKPAPAKVAARPTKPQRAVRVATPAPVRVAARPARPAPAPTPSPSPAANANGGAGTPRGVAPAFAGGQVATAGRLGILGNTDVQKAPFNIASYTEKFIRDKQAATISQALQQDPSVRAEQTRGTTVDAFYIRGFPFNEGNVGEFGFDGLYGIAPNSRIFTDYAERIEVLKGPSAAISGVAPNGAIGGVINIVPKRAGDDLTRVTMSLGTIAQGGAQVDIARRYGKDREWGIRFVGSGYGGHTPIDKQYERTGIGYLGIDHQGDRLHTWLYLLSQTDIYEAPSRTFLASTGATAGTNFVVIPGAPNGRLNITQPFEYSRQYDKGALLKNELEISDHVTLFGDFGGGLGQVNRFFGNPTMTSSAGDISNTPGFFNQNITRYTFDTGVRGSFDTGFIHHAVVVQDSYYHDKVDRLLNAGTTYTSNIFSPSLAPLQFPNTVGPIAPLAEDKLTGVSLIDTASVLNEHILLTAGVRRQEVMTNNFTANIGTLSSSIDKFALTPVVALVLRPTDNISFYGNYIEGLSRGDVAPTQATNSGTVLDPYISRQYEVGVKGQYGGLGTSLAAFQITKALGELDTSTLTFAATGEERVRGIELNLYGELRPGVRVLGGTSFLQGTLTKTALAQNIGNDPIGVPHVLVNIGGEVDLPGTLRGATLNGTVVYTAGQFVDTANIQPLSDWTRLDLGGRYVTTIDRRRTTFRVNVENVTGTHYYAGVASFGTFSIGAPRTVLGSVSVDL